MTRESQASLTRSIREMQEFRFGVRASVYDQSSRDDRIMLIGSSLNASPTWLDDHPRQAQWLRDEGLTAEHCRGVHAAWLESQLADPRWRR